MSDEYKFGDDGQTMFGPKNAVPVYQPPVALGKVKLPTSLATLLATKQNSPIVAKSARNYSTAFAPSPAAQKAAGVNVRAQTAHIDYALAHRGGAAGLQQAAANAPPEDTGYAQASGGGGGGGSTSDGSGAVDGYAVDTGAPATSAPYDDSAMWNDPSTAAVAASPSPTLAATPGTTTAIATATPAVTTAVVAPSLWTRFLAWLGFGKTVTPAVAAIHGEEQQLVDSVGSVVRRARNGDQNAMALISLVRENAMKGIPKSRRTYALMEEYIRLHPTDANIGAETKPRRNVPSHHPAWGKAVELSHGPLLSNSRIANIGSQFGADEPTFLYGVAKPEMIATNSLQHHGKVLGMARKLQAVRMHGSRISDYSPTVGWELGE